jgi:hypothetical protein
MNFTEINLLGVYVAPISLMMIGAWFVTIALRLLASRYGLLRSGIRLSSCSPCTSSFSRAGYCSSRGGQHDHY